MIRGGRTHRKRSASAVPNVRAMLGRKRAAGPTEDGECAGEAEAWFPGAGIPWSPFGETAVVERRTKHMRTTLLFTELEHEVTAEREAARRALHERCFRELRISAELAARFPLRAAEEGSSPAQARPREGGPGEVEAGGARCGGGGAEDQPDACMDAADQPDASTDVPVERVASCLRHDPALPRPLTERGMLEAFGELPEGARCTIQACLDCWHQGRLGNKDVVDTVRSFATKSEALRRLFADSDGAAPDPTATEQEMLQLMAGASMMHKC